MPAGRPTVQKCAFFAIKRLLKNCTRSESNKFLATKTKAIEKSHEPSTSMPSEQQCKILWKLTNLARIQRQRRLQAQIPTFLPNVTNLSENSSKIILSLFVMLDMECERWSPDSKDPLECVRTCTLPQFRQDYRGVPAYVMHNEPFGKHPAMCCELASSKLKDIMCTGLLTSLQATDE